MQKYSLDPGRVVSVLTGYGTVIKPLIFYYWRQLKIDRSTDWTKFRLKNRLIKQWVIWTQLALKLLKHLFSSSMNWSFAKQLPTLGMQYIRQYPTWNWPYTKAFSPTYLTQSHHLLPASGRNQSTLISQILVLPSTRLIIGCSWQFVIIFFQHIVSRKPEETIGVLT